MITMRDIAVRAGVSRSTVSFVLNDKHAEMGVNETTRLRVLKTAEELGYRRNELARAIATGKNPVFAFLVPDYHLQSEVSARVLAGALEEADAHQYVVQVIRVAGRTNDEEVVRRCIELRPTGVMSIYFQMPTLIHLQQEMSRFAIPVAVLESSPLVEGGTRIRSDDIDGCRQAIAHLVSLGHTRIAYIGGLTNTAASSLRDEGYKRAMAEQGLEILPGYHEIGYWEADRITEATVRLLQNAHQVPTAIFCADDRTAMVACRTLREHGLQVPRDVSLVGFANLVMSQYGDPPLTTLAQPFEEMGRIAVRRLLAERSASAAEREPDFPAETLLPTRLVVRRSTAPVKVG